MSRITVGWVVGSLAGVLWLGSFTVWGQRDDRPDPGGAPNAPTAPQPNGKAGPGSQSKRIVYFVKHGAAKELASALAKHFRGDVEIQLLPESSSDCLLITAAPAVFADTLKLLDQLDRRPRLISVELLVAEIASKKAEAAKPGPVEKELDASELTGPMGAVLAKVETLKKSGRISYSRRIQLFAAEGQQALVNIGEMKPWVTGTNVTGTGHVSRNITYRNTGTIVKITSRVTPDERVMIDLSIEDSRLRVPEDGVSLGTDEKNQPIPAAETTMAKLDTKLSVRSGQALAAQAVQTATKVGQEQIVVIVAARIVEPDAPRDK